MSGVRHVNKIPTIRGTDILRDARLNKVKRLKVVVNSQRFFFAHRTYQLTFIYFHFSPGANVEYREGK